VIHNGFEWMFYDSISANISVTPPIIEELGDFAASSVLFDDLTSVSGRGTRELPPAELRKLINVMKSRGLNTTRYEMILLQKYAEALSVIVLVLLVVPIGIDFSRRYSPIKSASVSFGFGLAFWGGLAAMQSLGTSGIIPPMPANFLPHAIFLMLGIFILYRREKAS
jgi:lipopolysaccharide export LptBFGC system permease protein LptF